MIFLIKKANRTPTLTPDTMTVSVDILQQFPLLSTLPRITLGELSTLSELRSYNKREIVVNKGSAASHMLFLFEGRLQGVDFTLDGKEVGCFFADPGDFLGELGVMDGQAHPETIISLGKSVVACVPSHIIRPMLTNMPAMAEQLTLKLAQKLRQASAQRRIIGLTNPIQKVCAQLVVMSHPSAQNNTVHLITQVPTHQELAIMINASRETVTRVFQLLQTKSMVVRDGHNLILQNIQILRDVSEGLKSDL